MGFRSCSHLGCFTLVYDLSGILEIEFLYYEMVFLQFLECIPDCTWCQVAHPDDFLVGHRTSLFKERQDRF
jgi:hypothetical protein